MTRHRPPTYPEKLAAVLLLLKVGDEWLIPEPTRSKGNAHEILRYATWDHYPIRRADGGTNDPRNIRPLSIAAHGEKTAKTDIPQIAKGKRLARSAEETRRIILARVGQLADAEVMRRKRKHPLPCGKASGWKKRLDGQVVRRVKP
jgi:hypothetical protein